MGKVLTIGESLLRLSTPTGQRLGQSPTLNIVYGGAESNVAINMAQLGHQVSYATKLPNNSLSQGVIHQLNSFGVNTDHVVYGGERIGVYYLESGASLRSSSVIYDRKHSAMAEMTDLEWDLDRLLADVELVHMSGVTLALSPEWQRMGIALIQEAKKRQIAVSFDMNYRAKLWSYKEARPIYRAVLPHVDYLSAGRLDAICLMDIQDEVNYLELIAERYPQLKVIYGTHRIMQTPNSYQLQGYIWSVEQQQYQTSKNYMVDEVVDRVGTGDSYASGILDGILRKETPQSIVEFATAAAVLKHSIFGDVNRVNRREIEDFMLGTSNIVR